MFSVTSEQDLHGLLDEIRKKFGPLPKEVQALGSVSHTKLVLKSLGAQALREQPEGFYAIKISQLPDSVIDSILQAIQTYPSLYGFKDAENITVNLQKYSAGKRLTLLPSKIRFLYENQLSER